MTNKHTSTYQIRHDECDAYGVLNNAVYLRLAQETARRHSEAAGFPPSYYENMQRAWVARDTEIEYLQPVGYGDNLAVTTFIASARRTAAQRAYKFRLGEELVAQARTVWVFFDVTRGVPASIPDEIFAIMFGQGEEPARLERSPFPEPPPAPPGVVKWYRRVEYRDVDPLGHLNNAAYLSYTQEAAVEAGLKYGVTQARSREEGLGWALKRSRIEYLHPALPEDELEVATWLVTLRKASAVRHYFITRVSDGRELARAESLWLTTDIITGKPRRLPQWMQEALEPNIGRR